MATHFNDETSKTYDLRAIKYIKPSNDKLENYTMEHLPLNTFQIDRSYQRELNHGRVGDMVASFSPSLLLPLAVNIRDAGEAFLVDGQHRSAMLASLGKGAVSVACVVYWGLSREEEAWLFHHLNKFQQKLTPMEQFRGALAAGDPEAIEIKEAVEVSGFVIRPEQRDLTRSNVAGVAALKRVRDQYGRERLPQVLNLIAQTWGTDHGPAAYQLVAVADFIYRYEGRFNVSRFVRVFAKTNPEMLNDQVRVTKVSGGMTFQTAWNYKLIEIYNKGLIDEKKLLSLVELRAQQTTVKGARHAT